MPRVYALIYSGFKKAAVRAVEWLDKLEYESILLDLPEDFTSDVKGYMDEELSLQELWRSYRYLTGFKQPYVNALKYHIGAVLKALRWLKVKIPDLEVYCYLDLKSHLEHNRLIENVILLETVERVHSRIKVDEWRTLLSEEYKCSVKAWIQAMENLDECLRIYEESVILYSGFVRSFMEYLRKECFKFKTIHLQHYWRPPLEALRMLMWMKGLDGVPDDVIISSVKNQLKYLDYVLSSDNIDEAHKG